MAAQKKPLLNLIIMSPEETMYDDKISSMTCHNSKGTFDVLPDHTNFMSMIDTSISILTADGSTKKFPINQAILQVKNNEIIVLLNIQQVTKKDSFIESLFKRN